MKINLAKYAGFCFGVKRAMDIVVDAAEKSNTKRDIAQNFTRKILQKQYPVCCPAEPCNRIERPCINQGGVLSRALLLPTSPKRVRQVNQTNRGRRANHVRTLFSDSFNVV